MPASYPATVCGCVDGVVIFRVGGVFAKRPGRTMEEVAEELSEDVQFIKIYDATVDMLITFTVHPMFHEMLEPYQSTSPNGQGYLYTEILALELATKIIYTRSCCGKNDVYMH